MNGLEKLLDELPVDLFAARRWLTRIAEQCEVLNAQLPSLAVALAPYQLAFVVVSVPVLLLTPLLVARNISKGLRDGCGVDEGRERASRPAFQAA